jgi:hypothetical protein
MPEASSRHWNLWKKQLGCVPDYAWKQTELVTLVLADNGLSEVSEQIGGLKKLRMLDPWQPLAHLPGSIATLPRLEKLDLRWVDRLAPPERIANLEERGCAVYL